MERKEQIEFLTRHLVRQESISNPEDNIARAKESLMASRIFNWLSERGVSSFLQELPDGRKNVFAFVPGKSVRTVVLAGHFDTVGIQEYLAIPGVEKSDPFNPDTLIQALQGDSDYVYGRGAFDMKSGLACAMVLMDEWNKNRELDGSVLFVATCDEENDSYGILNAIDVLLATKGVQTDSNNRYRDQVSELIGDRNLELQGVVNLDYTTERYPGDPNYNVWSGTIGKLLPSVLVRGRETHAGEHFAGFHASSLISRIVSEIDGNMEFSDGNLPPTTLNITDNRRFYNVMTVNQAKAYFNVFSVGKTPTEILNLIKAKISKVTTKYIADIDKNYKDYSERMFSPEEREEIDEPHWSKTSILTYSELLEQVRRKLGNGSETQIVREAIEKTKGDGRDKSFAIVDALLNALALQDPSIVVFYSPPFYPYIKPDNGKLYKSTTDAAYEVGCENNVSITMHHFYPYISDMSYLRLEPEILKSLGGLTEEMPVWDQSEVDPKKKDTKIYWLDLGDITRLNLPVVNVGPHGFGAHKTGERVQKYYSFEILPVIVDRIVRKMFEEN